MLTTILWAAAIVSALAFSQVQSLSVEPNYSDTAESSIISRRLVKRQVSTVYYPAVNSVRHMGLDPYEERLLIILLGSCIAVLFAIVFLIICCRTYRFDHKPAGGGVAGAAGGGMFQQQQQQQQQLMMYGGGGHAGRQAYFATGHQPGVAMDPIYLDPSKAGFSGGSVQQQQQQQQHQVDNTAYASLGPYSHQRM